MEAEDDSSSVPPDCDFTQEDIFMHFVSKALPRLTSYCKKLSRSSRDPFFVAEELVQHTLFKAWRNRAHFRKDAAVSSWLIRIAVNLYRDDIRRQKRKPEDSWDPFSMATVLQGRAKYSMDVDQVHEIQILDELILIADLPPNELVALQMRRDGYSFEEMSEQLSTPLSTGKTRYYKALRKLQSLVQT